MPYQQVNASAIKVYPLRLRRSFLQIESQAWQPDAPPPPAPLLAERFDLLAGRIRAARQRGASVMLTYGAHLIKNGGGPLVRALLERGWVTHVATQGAGVIHDWEFSHVGVSSESVRDNAAVGKFGAWDETGRWINLAVLAGAAEGLGYGESVGRLIETEQLVLPDVAELSRQIAADPAGALTAARADLLRTMQTHGIAAGVHPLPHPYKRYSVLAGAYARRVPFTVHCGIGYDIIVNHPLYHGAALGRGGTTDVRIFANSVMNLSGGVYLSIGCAIMSPQVFEKAFSVANNLYIQQNKPTLRDFTIAVVDIQDGGGWDWTKGEPPKDNPAYYLRFCKSFYRMGGALQYLQADNCTLLAHLLQRLK